MLNRKTRIGFSIRYRPPRQKNPKAREAKFCEILSPQPPAFRKISLAFRICISAHHILFKRLCGVQSVLPHFCFSRSTTLRVVALQRAGNASDYDFEKMFELDTIETPYVKSSCDAWGLFIW
jgi:hypothetical protein